jgi:hypothetical protein
MMPHIKDAWIVSKQAALHYECFAITRFIKLIYLRIVYGYSLKAAKFKDLLKPGTRITPETKWPGKRARQYINLLNPPEHNGETDDKLRFARTCLKKMIKAPPICGIFKPGGEFHRLKEDSQSPLSWETFLDTCVCDDFVVKPQFGYGGYLVHVFRKENNRIQSRDFGTMTPHQFYEKLIELYTNCPALLQERVYNHPDMEKLFQEKILTTARVNVIRKEKGDDHVLFGLIKFPGKNREIDNFGTGRSEGIMAEVNIGTGTIETTIQGVEHEFGFKIISHHPITGIQIQGVQIPLWKETCELAIQASKSMKHLRSVGWDIGITPDGPRIIEGNSAWGYPFTNERIHYVQKELVKVCGIL